jgi:hypothetical protein
MAVAGRVGRRQAELGADRASMYELDPGCRIWPYHTHHANEEGSSSCTGGRRRHR